MFELFYFFQVNRLKLDFYNLLCLLFLFSYCYISMMGLIVKVQNVQYLNGLKSHVTTIWIPDPHTVRCSDESGIQTVTVLSCEHSKIVLSLCKKIWNPHTCTWMSLHVYFGLKMCWCYLHASEFDAAAGGGLFGDVLVHGEGDEERFAAAFL